MKIAFCFCLEEKKGSPFREKPKYNLPISLIFLMLSLSGM